MGLDVVKTPYSRWYGPFTWKRKLWFILWTFLVYQHVMTSKLTDLITNRIKTLKDQLWFIVGGERDEEGEWKAALRPIKLIRRLIGLYSYCGNKSPVKQFLSAGRILAGLPLPQHDWNHMHVLSSSLGELFVSLLGFCNESLAWVNGSLAQWRGGLWSHGSDMLGSLKGSWLVALLLNNSVFGTLCTSRQSNAQGFLQKLMWLTLHLRGKCCTRNNK